MQHLVHTITEKAKQKRPFLVGISGIDGSGKGYVGQQLRQHIIEQGWDCHLLGIDGWLQLPSRRFSQAEPAEHFYAHAFRFDDMQAQLMTPLAATGSVNCTAQHADPSDREVFVDYHYAIADAEIVIFEGIFLFQKRFTFDYRIWIDCSFETALQRALARNQEGLSEERLKRDYREIYFAAQKLHLERDRPRHICDFIYLNDDVPKEHWP